MKLSCLSVLVIIPFSVSSQLHASAPEAQCYPLVHGEEGMGSTNSLFLPHLSSEGNWQYFIYVTNVSEKYINVKLSQEDFQGAVFIPQTVTFDGAFSVDNSPIGFDSSKAILKPRESGRIGVFDANGPSILSGTVSWQADVCIERALLVTIRGNYNDKSRLGSNIFFLNNGQPF